MVCMKSLRDYIHIAKNLYLIFDKDLLKIFFPKLLKYIFFLNKKFVFFITIFVFLFQILDFFVSVTMPSMIKF